MRGKKAPKFSERSIRQLASCHQKLVNLFSRVIEEYDCVILEGHRSAKRQNELRADGRSRVAFSQHMHSPSRAVDVAPYPLDWEDRERFYHFAGYVKGTARAMGIRIRWGGDWDGDGDFSDNVFDDLVHFELAGGDDDV